MKHIIVSSQHGVVAEFDGHDAGERAQTAYNAAVRLLGKQHAVSLGEHLLLPGSQLLIAEVIELDPNNATDAERAHAEKKEAERVAALAVTESAGHENEGDGAGDNAPDSEGGDTDENGGE